jgi:hypothetical protein
MKQFLFLILIFSNSYLHAQTLDSTYAEKLGYPKGAKVVILHVDDVGMSYDSNLGAIDAMTKGVATSCSVMMPCPGCLLTFITGKNIPRQMLVCILP